MSVRVIVIDLEEDRAAVDLERPKIVFFVRVIGVTKIVVHRDGFDDAGNGFGAEGGDTGCDQGRTDGEVLAQVVVKRTNGFGLRRHCCIS